jgi:hypothetical protein
MRSHLATAGTLSHRGERVRALAPRVALLPTGEGSRAGVALVARPDAERAAGHRGAPAGDNSALPENSPTRQAPDVTRLPALPTPSTKKTCPHRPRRRHPRPAFCPDEASSGGADDGREGGSRAGRPYQPGRAGVAGTAAPSVLQGATAPEAAVARGASLGGREEPAGGVTRPAGPGRGGQPPISPANGRKPQGASPGCRPERRDRRRWTRRPLLVLPPRTRGPGGRQMPR